MCSKCNVTDFQSQYFILGVDLGTSRLARSVISINVTRHDMSITDTIGSSSGHIGAEITILLD